MLFKPLLFFIIILSFKFALSDLSFRRRKLVRKNYVELEQERNYLIHFNYTFINSKLTHNPKTLHHKSDFLPWIVQNRENQTKKSEQYKEIKYEDSSNSKEPYLFDEQEHCKAKLMIPTLRFYVNHIQLCLFFAHWEEDVVEKMVVELKDNRTEVHQDYAFMKKVQPITGFVLNQRGSLVYGYIINSFFYGQVRLFDMTLNHFIVYYIEPLVNLPLYKPIVTIDEVRSHARGFLPEANACMFEYLMLSRASKNSVDREKYQDPDLPARRGKKVVHSTISPDRERTSRAPKTPPAPFAFQSTKAPLRKGQLFYFSTKKPQGKQNLIVYSTIKPRAHATAPPTQPTKKVHYSTTAPPAKTTPYKIIRSTPPSEEGTEGMETIIRSSTPAVKPEMTPLTIIHSSEVPDTIGDTIIHSTTSRPTGIQPTPSDLPIIHSTTKSSKKTPRPIIHSTTKKTNEGKSYAKMMKGRSINDIVVEVEEDNEEPEDHKQPPCDRAAPPAPPPETEPPTTPEPPSTSPPSTPETTWNTIIYSSTQLPPVTSMKVTTTTARTTVKTTTALKTVKPTTPKTVKTTTIPTTVKTTVRATSTEAFIHSTKTPGRTIKGIIFSTRVPEKKVKTSSHFISSHAPKRIPHPTPTTQPTSTEATSTTTIPSFIMSSVAPKKAPMPPFFLSTPRPSSPDRKVFKSTVVPKKVSVLPDFIASTVPTANKVLKPPKAVTKVPTPVPQPQEQQGEVFEEKRIKFTTVKASMLELAPSPPPPTTHARKATKRRRRRRRKRAIAYHADIDENDIYASTVKSDEDFGEELFEKPKSRRRIKRDMDDNVDDEWEHEHVHEEEEDENAVDDDDDMIEEVMYPKGNKATGKVEVFDLYREQSLLCNLCIWLQPLFAFNFGFQHGIHFGAAEIIDLVRYMNWIFRPMDFNMDFRPENVGFRVRKILVVEIPEIENISPNEWKEDARKVMPLVKRVVSNKFSEKCCAILAYVYRDMDPFGSLSSRSALCVKNKNFAMITGRMMGIKIAKYDVYRFTSHAIGHLIGSLNDDSGDTDCYDKNMDTFNNQFIMHSTHQLNIGIRPNAMRMSYCSRIKVSVFLSSSRPSCFEPSNYTYCGNGILEDGEDCDCGAPWQCEHIEECCGLRDSFNPCKVINKIPGKVCRLPQMMESDFEKEAEGEF